jgi:hypothetical protein
MGSSVLEAKREEAELNARRLADGVDGVEGVLLFGSVARGDAEATSDIDLMVVSRSPLPGQTLRSALGGEAGALVCHTWESFRQARRDDWSFFVHLREEGRRLHDPHGRLAEELRAVRRPRPDALRSALERERDLLGRYDDLERFAGRYHFALARAFTAGRYVCMLDNTAAGTCAFSREEAFDLYARRYPGVKGDVERVRALWPFLARAQGRTATPLPFACDSRREAVESLAATRRIVDAAIDG